MKSVPLVKSSQSCDQDVSSQGVITRALCHEVHTFRPFSSETGGATTEVSQKLTFSKELKAHRDSSFYSGMDFL
ncbi:hypothetical protein DPMN_105051 [Dreissena polymorpha]|uniref:Uncharacterized protein n=1 Tax=Dreissena polymorpha TaxID=45954 RepID=A0A9D4H8V6_DREPO|nr:hypothetical protein DPMN_105051 [Dreissena polymorpha]